MTSSSKTTTEISRAASYARFIPREELTSFAAWSPGSLDGLTAPSHTASGAPAPASSPPAPAPDTEASARVPAEPSLETQLQQSHDRGYQDGYRDGLAALEMARQQLATQYASQIGALVQALDAQFDALQAQLAERLADVSVTLARQVVRSEIRQRPEVVVAVAQEALDTLLHTARRVILRVNPSDLPLVQAGAGDLLAARETHLVADEQIAAGGCVIDSDIGVVDASIPSSWQRALAAMGRDASMHPPILDPDPPATPAAASAAGDRVLPKSSTETQP